ncbi:MAG: T9SS type A sorting domain-containing protein [Brumimicrobium sp.]|nr:T9SS type A sorting domain-containing protein [Brumimicrobium sp.]
MKHFYKAIFIILGFLVFSFTGRAQFSGNYAPSNWTLILNTPPSDGYVDITYAPDSIILAGDNDDSGACCNESTVYQTTVCSTGTISFDYSFVNPDIEEAYYIINGTSTFITGLTSTGTVSNIPVTAGDVFGFMVYTNDDCCGRGILTISNFSAPSVQGTTYTETACFSYTWPQNWQTYTESGIYRDTMMNWVGCDSIITLDLTIDTVNTTVLQNGSTLTADLFADAYQWIDCNNGNVALMGETNQSFTAEITGIYAVMITLNGCTDTSECIFVNTIGLSGENLQGGYVLFPNPSKQHITLRSADGFMNTTVRMLDLSGKTMLKREIKNGKEVQLGLTDFAPGIYFIEVIESSRVTKLRFVKE